MASDFTDGLALKAIELVFRTCPGNRNPGDAEARENAHAASQL